jgi:hypothetical protein
MDRRRVVAVPFIVTLAAFALIAASCGADSETDSAPTSAPITTDAPDREDAGTPETTETAPLTASFRGVTPEVIRVGILAYDWDRLAALGVSFGTTNTGDLALAALAAINDRGGIHGRMIDPYLVEFLPVGSDESDKACVELTEDHEVFVVMGTTLNDQVLCFTELNDTAVIGVTGMTDARRDRSIAPYATVLATTEQRTTAFIEMMQSAGVLDGATVGVIGSADVSEDAFRTMVDGFRTAGFAPVEGLIGGNADDLAASAREQGLIYERMVGAGVDLTVSTTGVPLEIANAVEAGYQTDQWLLSTVMTGTGLTDAGVPHEYLDGALAVVNTPVGTSAQPALADDPLTAACIDDLVERTGHPLPYSLDVETNDIGSGLFTCAIATILEQALLAAGPELTNDSFRAGLESIGDIELPGFSDASLGPDDMGAAKGLTLVEFDAASGSWDPVG